MKRAQKRQIVFFSIAIGFCCLFQGCESAESYADESGVEANKNNDSDNGNNNGNDSGNGGGGTGVTPGGGTDNGNDPTFTSSSVVAFKLSPGETTISRNERKRFTIPNPKSGYVYKWELDKGSIGKLTPDPEVSNDTAYYYQGTEFPAGGAAQKILVVGTQSGSNIRHEGMATVTHQAQ